jgi:hypothetical protein
VAVCGGGSGGSGVCVAVEDETTTANLNGDDDAAGVAGAVDHFCRESDQVADANRLDGWLALHTRGGERGRHERRSESTQQSIENKTINNLLPPPPKPAINLSPEEKLLRRVPWEQPYEK